MKPLPHVAFVLLAVAGVAAARNVDLSTIPPRDTVQLTIYNTEDLTLVRETRHLTFKRGVNPLQFSWANTLIDPTSVELRFRTHTDELELLDTTFPHDKPQMLAWNVNSRFDGDAVVEITYFTSGIAWTADYVCISDPAEQTMHFEGFVRITNQSGEDYADAHIRLVVGTINLVEKVAELARRGIISMEESQAYSAGRLRALGFRDRRAGRELGDEVRAGIEAVDVCGRVPKEVIKQGLSEYFIYTIAGTETVRHTWSKRMRSFEGQDVPFRIQYRYRPAEYGEQMVRMFLLRNDEASDLGTTPLPDGIVRLFRDNGRDGLSFLVQQQIKYVPIGQEIELNLGPDPEVIHEWVRLRSWRENFWFRRHNLEVRYSPTQGHRIEVNDTVDGWEDHAQWVERIRNYRAKPIDVEIRRHFDGHIVFRSQFDPRRHDYRTVEITCRVDAGQKRELPYHVVALQGYLCKQGNVAIETGD